MLKDTMIATLCTFFLGVILYPLSIPLLHRLKFGQFIRQEGPKDHQKKAGTPTMGGIIFLLAIGITELFFAHNYPNTIPVVLFMIAFGIIGFLDDWMKVVKKRNEGLRSVQKLGLQFLVTTVMVVYLHRHPELGRDFLIPFTGGISNGQFLCLGVLFFPVVYFVVLGTDNGVNFTDGLDGLCASVTIAVAVFYAAFAIKENLPVAPAAGMTIGVLLAFLLWNVYPAKVFMGDTGSLALGGFISSYALMTRLSLFIPVVGFIYLAEVLSVMMQVSYYKATHGKRIFRMTPIHHHFELGGWSETRIVCVFTVVTVILGLVAYMCL